VRFEKGAQVILLPGGPIHGEGIIGPVLQSNHAVTTIRTASGYELTAPSVSFRAAS
jgi:hypothetical protein